MFMVRAEKSTRADHFIDKPASPGFCLHVHLAFLLGTFSNWDIVSFTFLFISKFLQEGLLNFSRSGACVRTEYKLACTTDSGVRVYSRAISYFASRTIHRSGSCIFILVMGIDIVGIGI